jgi:pSer/pThr/pTyr-binding forkhead associated (FHA) protein
VPESLLTILKFCFLALLYLFFVRVVRAVWAEVTGAPAAAPAAAPAPTRERRPKAAAPGRGGGRLRILEPDQLKGRTFELSGELTIGRAAGCQIPLDDSYVSQVHARVFRRDGDVLVEDLGSTNGTFLNRKKVGGAVPMRRGDRLQIGRTVLELTK